MSQTEEHDTEHRKPRRKIHISSQRYVVTNDELEAEEEDMEEVDEAKDQSKPKWYAHHHQAPRPPDVQLYLCWES